MSNITNDDIRDFPVCNVVGMLNKVNKQNKDMENGMFNLSEVRLNTTKEELVFARRLFLLVLKCFSERYTCIKNK